MDLILTLSVSLAAALILGYVTQRLGLSPLVGYLLAGVLVSPNTPGLFIDREIAEQLASIGIVLLMFGIGLHFDPKELFGLRKVALPGALVLSVTATALGAGAAFLTGGAPGWAGSIVYGLALAVASTVVMTRVLSDHDDLHSPAGRLAVGWTIVEDLLTVIILILLPAVAPSRSEAGGPLVPLLVAFAKIAVLLVVLFLVGARVVPWLLRKVAETRSRELFTLTVLAVALGIAYGSSRLFGVSIALGAFLGGMVVGRTDFSLRAATEALPMRDAFAVIFFVSVGMLFDPRSILETPWLAAATLGIVVLARPLVSFTMLRVLRQPPRTALSVGLALGQIGEFSFILAGMGTALGLLPARAASALVLAAIVSIGLNPLLRRLIDPLDSLSRRTRPAAQVGRRDDTDAPAVPGQQAGETLPQAVIIGYGPIGRTLGRLLAEQGVTCTVIEMNLQTVHRLRAQGITAVYGDASHGETLREAGVPRAGSLILSASGLHAAAEIIRIAREMNPDLRIIVRTAYLRERDALREAGADLVFSGEGEVALAMHEAILGELGGRVGKAARDRERLRSEL